MIKDSFKVFVYYIVAYAFTLCLNMFLGGYDTNRAVLVLHQIANLLFVILFIFYVSYNQGFHAYNLVKNGRQKECKAYGLFTGLLAISPTLLVSLLTIFSKLQVLPDILNIYRLFNSPYVPIVHAMLESTYMAQVSMQTLLITMLFPLIVPVVSAISYAIGYRQIFISDVILYKK